MNILMRASNLLIIENDVFLLIDGNEYSIGYIKNDRLFITANIPGFNDLQNSVVEDTFLTAIELYSRFIKAVKEQLASDYLTFGLTSSDFDRIKKEIHDSVIKFGIPVTTEICQDFVKPLLPILTYNQQVEQLGSLEIEEINEYYMHLSQSTQDFIEWFIVAQSN